jgi:tetratricopeptide (TPR) repeat protein
LPQFATIAIQSLDKRAAHIAAEGYLLKSLVELEQCNLTEMEKSSELAIQYARISEDNNLLVAAYKHKANRLKKTAKGIQAYHAALTMIDMATPLLRSSIYFELASATAKMSDVQAAYRYMGLAKESFPNDFRSDPSFLIADSDLAQLYAYEGEMYLKLGQPQLAWQALANIDGINPTMPIGEYTQLSFLAKQARTGVGLRDIELSGKYAETLILLTHKLNSQYGASKINEVIDIMQLMWPTEPRVKALG